MRVLSDMDAQSWLRALRSATSRPRWSSPACSGCGGGS